MNPFLTGLMQQGLNFGLGVLQDRYQDKRQLKQNAALMQQSIEGQKEMGLFNQGLQMQMLRENQSWNSPKAMLARIKEAGLSPALMYGGTGAGISGTSGQAGGAQGGSPMMGRIDMFKLQAELDLLEAQKNNLEATSKKTEAEAAKIEGVDTEESKGRIENLKADARLKGLDEAFNNVRNQIQSNTQYVQEDLLQKQLDNLIADEAGKLLDNEFNDMTLETRAEMLFSEAAGVAIENELKRANIDKTEAEIDKMANDIAIAWKNSGLIESAQVLQKKDLDRKERELAETKHRNNIAAFEAQIKREYQPIWNVGGRGLDMFSRSGDRIIRDLFGGGYKEFQAPQR